MVYRYVRGFLKVGRRGLGRPDQGLPGEEEDMTPGWGLPEGEGPEVEPPDIDPPPGVWPGPSPGHPIVPIPPAGEGPGHLPSLPPGGIWPRPPGPVEGLFLALCHIPGHGWKYVVIDPDAIVIPEPPAGGVGGRPPGRPEPAHR
jgi:hypothetical protein